ncbi:cobalamin biosynthesis protein [Nocardioides panacis]|uniref:Cobalamin biosynthesis protein CobD n=1 Tax=Nocardioides panacis TaxID=2849501 RepID=A0A975SVD2_9ACTN|nr:cobalamin biosynthesis protein [Nocardioides panacis]QWZ06538.1 cobalamin biosynthesis protein [Nocardioides panacis]
MGRVAGLVLGCAADRLLGDPRRFHPVAGFGRFALAVESRTYADHRAAGGLHSLVVVGGTVLLARTLREGTLVTALCTWTVLGGRSLAREAAAVAAHLEAGDLPAARERVTHLVGRDPSRLGPDEVARATVESVAENTSDAVVAPLLWGAVAGPAGLLGYRAVNTLDAMVGHRSPRYLRFGWASARLDDAANLVPARVTALLAATGAPGPALRAWRRDAGRHPSPNAGPVEAAFAGALGLRLGGRNRYGEEVQDRGFLGDGRPPAPGDIGRAVVLADRVGAAALSLAVLGAIARRRGRR